MATVLDISKIVDVKVFDDLMLGNEVPVISTSGAQGDVSVLRVTTGRARTPLPQQGFAVVRGEAGGNTHSLHAGPDSVGVCFDPVTKPQEGSLLLGVLTVPRGQQAVLAHPEHGFLTIEPGTYQIGCQREWAGQWRVVAD